MKTMDETLLKTKKFDVKRREYDIPGTGTVQRDMVARPGAALILPVLSETESETQIVVIRNYRYTVGRELIELPAGTLEPPEPPIECAARELEEETGYAAREIEPLAEYYTSPGFTDERMYLFVARNLTRKEQKLEATEQIRVETVTLDEALAATTTGRIIDAKTIAALHIYHHARKAKGSL